MMDPDNPYKTSAGVPEKNRRRSLTPLQIRASCHQFSRRYHARKPGPNFSQDTCRSVGGTRPAWIARGSNNARVTIHGKRIWLGKYNSPESIAKYQKLVAELEARQASDSTITIGRLAILFMQHAEHYYRKPDGTPTNEAKNFRFALKSVCREFPDLPVRNFGPVKLQQVRDKMVKSGLARNSINARVRRIRQVVKWAVSQELCQASVLQGLQAVEALKIGRTRARETDNVGPVSLQKVEAVRPFVSRQIWAAIQFMLLLTSLLV